MPYDEKLAERVQRKLKGERGLVEKKMFGGIGFLLNGNMACGVHRNDLIVRLGDEEFEAALKKPHVRVFDMTGRPMRGWIMVSPEGLSTDRALHGWVERSVAFARSLPAK